MRIMNSISFEESAHKLMSLRISKEERPIICDVLLEAALWSKTYQDYHGLLAQRLSEIDPIFKSWFFDLFI